VGTEKEYNTFWFVGGKGVESGASLRTVKEWWQRGGGLVQQGTGGGAKWGDSRKDALRGV